MYISSMKWGMKKFKMNPKFYTPSYRVGPQNMTTITRELPQHLIWLCEHKQSHVHLPTGNNPMQAEKEILQ